MRQLSASPRFPHTPFPRLELRLRLSLSKFAQKTHVSCFRHAAAAAAASGASHLLYYAQLATLPHSPVSAHFLVLPRQQRR